MGLIRGAFVPMESIRPLDRMFEETTPEANGQSRSLAEALATTDVLRAAAGPAAIHLYEMDSLADGSYVCTPFMGEGLKSLLGPLPGDRTPEEAWEDAVHPD